MFLIFCTKKCFETGSIEIVPPQPPHLILIRHPEDFSNAQRKFNGQLDTPLTYNGERTQLRRLLRQLKSRYPSVDAVYSSPLNRAYFPAILAAEDYGITEGVHIDYTVPINSDSGVRLN